MAVDTDLKNRTNKVMVATVTGMGIAIGGVIGSSQYLLNQMMNDKIKSWKQFNLYYAISVVGFIGLGAAAFWAIGGKSMTK